MKDRLLPHPLLTLALALTWLLLNDSLAPGQILLALALGWTIPLFTRRFWPEPVRLRRPLVLARFLARVFSDILRANFTVAFLILRGPRHVAPGFVEVPLDLRGELAIALLINTISLTPGTVSAWLSPDRRTLVVHVLKLRDPGKLVQNIKRRYEAPLLEILEPC